VPSPDLNDGSIVTVGGHRHVGRFSVQRLQGKLLAASARPAFQKYCRPRAGEPPTEHRIQTLALPESS
jgi:hypothetical protein